jgi:hypothetical protein
VHAELVTGQHEMRRGQGDLDGALGFGWDRLTSTVSPGSSDSVANPGSACPVFTSACAVPAPAGHASDCSAVSSGFRSPGIATDADQPSTPSWSANEVNATAGSHRRRSL